MANYNTIAEVSANVVSIETGEFTRTYNKTDLKCSITDRSVFVYYYTDSSNMAVASWTLEQAITYGYSTLAELKTYIDTTLILGASNSSQSNLLAFPASEDLTNSDIGKLVMNTGNEVVVARRNGVVQSQQGEWIVTFNNFFPIPQAASIEMEFGTTMSEGDTIRLLNKTYRFTAAPNFSNDILIEADNETQADSFCNRLNADLGNYLTASLVTSSTVKLLFDGESAPMVEDLNEKGKFLANFKLDAMIELNCVNTPALNNYTAGELNAMEYDYNGGYQFCNGAVGVAALDMLKQVMGTQGQVMWGLNFPTTPEEMANNFAIVVNSLGPDYTATVIGDGTQVEILANVQPSKPGDEDIVIIDQFLTQASIETIAYNIAESEIALPYPVLGQLVGFSMDGTNRNALIKDSGILKVKLKGSVDAIAAINPLAGIPIPAQLFMGFAVVNEGGVEVFASSSFIPNDSTAFLEIYKNMYVIKSNAEVGQDVLVQKLDGFDFIMGLQL